MAKISLVGKSLRCWSTNLDSEEFRDLSESVLKLEGDSMEIGFLESDWIGEYVEMGLCPALEEMSIEIDGEVVHKISWGDAKLALSESEKIFDYLVAPGAMALRSINNNAEWAAEINGDFSIENLEIIYGWFKFPDTNQEVHGTVVPVIYELYYKDGGKNYVEFNFVSSGHLDQLVIFTDSHGTPRNVNFLEPDFDDERLIFQFSLLDFPEEGGLPTI